MSAAPEFEPEWRLCHAPHCRCTICSRVVEEEYVWRYFDSPSTYRWNVCQECVHDRPA